MVTERIQPSRRVVQRVGCQDERAVEAGAGWGDRFVGVPGACPIVSCEKGRNVAELSDQLVLNDDDMIVVDKAVSEAIRVGADDQQGQQQENGQALSGMGR